MTGRIVIDNVRPRTTTGDHPAKGAVGLPVTVSADIFRDGHDHLAARCRWRRDGEKKWSSIPMTQTVNDLWETTFTPEAIGGHTFVVEAWTDRIDTWRHDVEVKHRAGQDVELELEEGARLLVDVIARVPKADRAVVQRAAETLQDNSRSIEERLAAALDPALAAIVDGVPDPRDLTATNERPLWIDRLRGQQAAWYELFPRSEGGFKGTMERLPAIAEMGFDIVYLPPIHPIGRSHRKGRNNTLGALPEDVGSPWAIGGEEGGHCDVHPDLGTIDDFDRLVEEAQRLGMEIALDYALQCSPDHPWVREHPEWFHHRPDGSIKYAENPPKKYQDIYPINFWPDDDADRKALWDACKEIFDHWIGHGVRVFRVDNPHTKPVAFWEWVIPAVQKDHPDTLFLAEAFTRPKMMAKLAEVGFSQSYTYFTWRTAKEELREYLEELSQGPTADFMRPNFWPNTPDILSGPLRNGPPAAFQLRVLLAATMTPSYGIYSGYELCENEPASDTNEEYLYSEKYECKDRDWDQAGSLTPFITTLNDVRRRHRCFEDLRNIRFHHSGNPSILVYSKHSEDFRDVVLTVVNLDPVNVQEDTLWIDLGSLQIPWDHPFEAHDELTGATYVWHGPSPYVRLDPAVQVGHVLHLRPLRPVTT